MNSFLSQLAGCDFTEKELHDSLTALNTIHDGTFRDCSRMRGGDSKMPHDKTCHTYPTMIKLGTVIP